MKNFLTPLEQNELKTRHRAEKNRRDADRIKAILLSDQGRTYGEIAQALLLNVETIMRYVHAYAERKWIALESGAPKRKLNEV